MLHQGAEQHIAVTGKRKDGENPSHASQCRNQYNDRKKPLFGKREGAI
jgi:hypothetical protein